MSDVRLTWPGRTPPPPVRTRLVTPLWTWPQTRPEIGHARLMAGEALAVLDALLGQGLAGQVDLVYLDPPFGAGVTWPRKRDVQTATGAESRDAVAYEDPEDGLAAWLQHLDAVLARVHQLLSPRGSVYLHLDFRRAPHARLLLDERFGPDNLKNEIVWAYGLGGSSPDRYGRKHDVIQFYAKDARHTHFSAPLQRATSQRLKGQAKRATDVWQTKHRGEDAAIEGAWPDELVELTLSNSDKQRTGYPTQKPIALLDRIVQASLPAGGLALDPMAGSGTLGVAAVRAGGRAILGDRSLVALDASRGRLRELGAGVQLDVVDGAVQVKAHPGPLAQHAGTAVTWLDGALAESLSAWGVVDRAGHVLAWWDGGAQRLREQVPGQLQVAGPAHAVVAVTLDGSMLRSEL